MDRMSGISILPVVIQHEGSAGAISRVERQGAVTSGAVRIKPGTRFFGKGNQRDTLADFIGSIFDHVNYLKSLTVLSVCPSKSQSA
jgi:hypothetical protein